MIKLTARYQLKRVKVEALVKAEIDMAIKGKEDEGIFVGEI